MTTVRKAASNTAPAVQRANGHQGPPSSGTSRVAYPGLRRRRTARFATRVKAARDQADALGDTSREGSLRVAGVTEAPRAGPGPRRPAAAAGGARRIGPTPQGGIAAHRPDR